MQKTYKNKCVLVQKMDIIKIKEQTRKEVWDLYTLCEHELHNLKVYVDEEIPISKDTFLSMRNIKTNLINFMELADKRALSLEQKLICYELYDDYCQHGGNSFVHDKWEKLKKEGKL